MDGRFLVEIGGVSGGSRSRRLSGLVASIAGDGVTKRRGIQYAAFLVALILHVAGVCVVTAGGNDGADSSSKHSAKALSVDLLPSGTGITGGTAVWPAPLQRVNQAAEEDADMTPLRRTLKEKKPFVALVQPQGPYYFRMNELTQKPALLVDPVAALVLRAPGLPPQPVLLRLLIGDEGRVDRVIVENSFLAADIERQVMEAFAEVRFAPGKIGRIAVRSQLRVEARLESVELLPQVTNTPG